MRKVGGVRQREVERAEEEREQPRAGDDGPARDTTQRGNGQAAHGQAEHEDRHHRREGEMRGAEREAADADQDGLHRHHREAQEARGGGEEREAWRCFDSRGRLIGEGQGIGSATEEGEEHASRDVDGAHGEERLVDAERRDQHERGGQRAGKCPGSVESIDEGVETRCVGDAARKRLGEDRNRAAHQHRRWADQQCRERDVEREGEQAALDRQEKGECLHALEEEREGECPHADAGLHRSVDEEQGRRPVSRLGALHHAPHDCPEHGVAQREPAEVDAEHGCGRLAVRAEQRGQALLPGHLVHQAGEAGENGEQQGCNPDHVRPFSCAVAEQSRTARVALPSLRMSPWLSSFT